MVSLLGITPAEDRKIYLGQTNIIHMQADHPDAFENYGREISNILSSPDYIRLSTNNSIEYVKVAVRLSGGSRYYARTLYVLNSGRVENFVRNGELKPY